MLVYRLEDKEGFGPPLWPFTGEDDDVVTFRDGQVMFNREKASAVGGFCLSRALRILFREEA